MNRSGSFHIIRLSCVTGNIFDPTESKCINNISGSSGICSGDSITEESIANPLASFHLIEQPEFGN